MTRSIWTLLLTLSLLTLSACSDDDSGSDTDGSGTDGSGTDGSGTDGSGTDGSTDGGGCDAGFTACGGDPIGAWTLHDVCVSDPSLGLSIEGCPEATIAVTSAAVSGTLTITADTYAIDQTFTGVVEARVPLSCLNGGSCADLAQEIGGACATADGDVCECTREMSDVTNERGALRIDGTVAYTTAEGSTSETTNDFCVQGDTLSWRSIEEDTEVVPVVTATR